VRDERHREFAIRGHTAYRAARRTADHPARWRSECATPTQAFTRALDLGAWAIPVRARAMELNIPAIHGVGESLIYFVDRYDDFSIYDIDFRAIPTVDPHPPAIAGMNFFGIVQYIGADRTADWGRVLFAGLRLRAAARQRALRSASCQRACCCRVHAARSICS